MKVLLLTPELNGFGGVQRFSSHTSLALSQLSKELDFGLDITSLMDQELDPEMEYIGPDVYIESSNSNKIKYIRDCFRSFSQDTFLVYATHVNLLPIAVLLQLVFSGTAVGVHLHGIEAWGKLKLHRKLSLKRSDFYTSSSFYTAEVACARHGLNKEKMTILHPPLDPFWSPLSAADDETKRGLRQFDFPYILTVARLSASEKEKGLDSVIRAMKRLKDKYPELRYVIVGSGDDKTRLESIAEGLGIRSRIHFTGNVSEQVLQDIYRNSELFIMPSKKEGLGIVYLEAMAYKKPIIACEIGGSVDAVAAGETGLFVEYGNDLQISDAVLRITKNPELQSHMGQKGFEYLTDRFTFAKFKERWVKLLTPYLNHANLTG